jgi:hypothetical protein
VILIGLLDSMLPQYLNFYKCWLLIDTSRLHKAKDYEGEGGPEDKARRLAEEQGGDDSIRGNIRQ